MLLASTGIRAVEALSIRLKDLDIESSTTGHPPTVTIKGEYTKTKVDRYVFLTREMADVKALRFMNDEVRKHILKSFDCVSSSAFFEVASNFS
jgi:integrase